jgi:teichuronic acid biosynthesis glycosyltransferase TuaG
MVSPLVSIVIPLFNKEDFIIQTLNSVVVQTYKSWECIIVDDGSTDASPALVKDFFSKHNINYTFLTQVNHGPSSARNLGIKASNGVYVALLDADDVWLPSKLERQVAFMEDNPDINLCLTNYIIFNDDKPRQIKVVRAKNPLTQIKNWLNMRGFGGLVESTGLFRRACVNDEILFDPNMQTTEGLDFTVKWFLNGRIEVFNQLLTLYRISNNQLHKNTELIKRNVHIMSLRYPFLVSDKESLSEFHRAYFELSRMRSSGFTGGFRMLMKRIGKLDTIFFRMAYSIFLRNLLAKFISPPLRRQILNYIEKLNY